MFFISEGNQRGFPEAGKCLQALPEMYLHFINPFGLRLSGVKGVKMAHCVS